METPTHPALNIFDSRAKHGVLAQMGTCDVKAFRLLCLGQQLSITIFSTLSIYCSGMCCLHCRTIQPKPRQVEPRSSKRRLISLLVQPNSCSQYSCLRRLLRAVVVSSAPTVEHSSASSPLIPWSEPRESLMLQRNFAWSPMTSLNVSHAGCERFPRYDLNSRQTTDWRQSRNKA